MFWLHKFHFPSVDCFIGGVLKLRVPESEWFVLATSRSTHFLFHPSLYTITLRVIDIDRYDPWGVYRPVADVSIRPVVINKSFAFYFQVRVIICERLWLKGEFHLLEIDLDCSLKIAQHNMWKQWNGHIRAKLVHVKCICVKCEKFTD